MVDDGGMAGLFGDWLISDFVLENAGERHTVIATPTNEDSPTGNLIHPFKSLACPGLRCLIKVSMSKSQNVPNENYDSFTRISMFV